MITKAKRRWRIAKTVILAIAAAGALSWSAIESWGVDPQELWDFFLLCLLLLGVTAVLGVVGAVLLVALRKFRA